MKNKPAFRLVIILLLLSFFPGLSLSDDEKKDTNFLEVSVMVGSVTNGDILFNENTELFIDSSYTASATLAFYFSRVAALEISFHSRFDKAFYVPDKSLEIDPSNYNRENFYNFHINMGLMYNFGDLVHVPFISVGGGITNLEYNDKFDVPSCNNHFTLYGAAGYKYYLAENFAARVQMTLEFFEYENLNNQDEFFPTIMLTAGLSFNIK